MSLYVHGGGPIARKQARVLALEREAADLEAAARARITAARAAIAEADRSAASATRRRDEHLAEIEQQIAGATEEAHETVRRRTADLERAALHAEHSLDRRRKDADAAKRRVLRRMRKLEQQTEDLETLILNVERRATVIKEGSPPVHGGRAGLEAAAREIQQHAKDKASRR